MASLPGTSPSTARSHHIMETTSSIRSVTLWGMALNLLLSGLKFLIGILFASQACIADAIHSLSDSVTDLAVIIGVRFWSEPADADHPHGHQRIEAIITLFIGIALALVGAKMMYGAIESIAKDESIVPGWPVFGVAIASIVVKEWLYHWTVAVGRRCHSQAVIANAWHHRSDAFSSIPVAVTTLLCRLFPEQLTHLDACAAVIVSLLLIKAACDIAWPAVQELTDRGASQPVRKRILDIAHQVEGVRDVHDLRTRRLGDNLDIDIHILVDPDLTVQRGHDICNRVAERLLAEKDLHIADILTHLEPWNEQELAEGHTEDTTP